MGMHADLLTGDLGAEQRRACHRAVRRRGSGDDGLLRHPRREHDHHADKLPGQLARSRRSLWPRLSLVDLKLAKNIRLRGKRLNVGVDIYNLFNNNAIRAYQTTFPADGNGVPWGTPTALLSPRFARAQVQFDF